MKQITPSLEYYGQYSELFRSQIHQIIAWGYEDALPRIRSGNKKEQQETAITGFIVSSIKDRIRAIDRPSWLRYYSVHDDPPVEAKGKSGRSRPRVDIIIEGSGFNGSPEYLFEAKRLRKDGYGVGKYTGIEGMGCFIEELYAKRYDEVAMIGYVQSELAEDWKKKILDKIQSQKTKLQLSSHSNDVSFLNSLPHEWESKHRRKQLGRPVTIYHILLDCCEIN